MNLKNYLKILLLCCMLCGCNKARQSEAPDMEWWREARFGMFIHWGLYSVAAGQWDGKDIDGIGEWIQNFAKIPNSDYEKLAADFTLANYHPEEWVMLAKPGRSTLYRFYHQAPRRILLVSQRCVRF